MKTLILIGILAFAGCATQYEPVEQTQAERDLSDCEYEVLSRDNGKGAAVARIWRARMDGLIDACMASKGYKPKD